MVYYWTEATLLVVGLEKAIAKMENSMLKFQASRVAPLMTFPTFDGSGALTWLARANQYFFFNKTPLDRRVDVAMIAINGPAKPWKQLLVRRCPSLSWDRFVRELLNRFGDTTVSGSTPPMTLPTFDGSDVIAWLARAEQYFLVSKIPPENRLSAAMVVLAGPALPWIQLLMRRVPTLSWDRFTHEMMNRFGDTIPQESRVTSNSSKQGSEGPIAAVQIAKNQPKIPPTPINITAAAAAVVSPHPSAAMALKNPPNEVPFPKLSVTSNGQPPKEHKLSILGETTSECGLKVPDVFEDPYMGIVPVSAPSSPPLSPPPVLVLEFNSSSHVSSERQMKHSAKEWCFSKSLFSASSHKPGNQLVHRPHRQVNIYKLEFEPPPDLHLRIWLALRTRLF